MGNDPTDESADARGVLASWLDDYTAGRCDRAEMQASFLEICRGNPEAPWDALALLDQYQRRGRVDALLARSLKSDIAQLVFGVANQAEDPPTEEPVTDSDIAADSTGSRWRKILADRGSAAVAPGESFGDPTQYRRDFDPLTRPPQSMKSRQAAGGTAGILRERYELLTILGRGHSGTVYKALDRHRAHLNESERCVALRVLKLNYQDRPDALADLEREFHRAQSLSHPNVISMFDLDRDGGTYFMVMELLEGELLSDVLRRLDHRPMARERALSIIGSIGAALAHAHRRNIVHADLKPAKVMVTATGEVKVLDFGFAPRQRLEPRRAEPWLGESDGGITPTSTPAYASAERVNGEEPHSSEDVYSLACIAYELLSGHHPYGGRSAPLARAHGREPQRIPGLSNRQWNVLRAALQWSRAERRIDVVELIAGLGCADVPQRLSGPEELLSDDSTSSRTGRKAVVWVLLLAAVGGVGYLYWQNPVPLPKFSINAPAKPEPQATTADDALDEALQAEPVTTSPSNELTAAPAAIQPPAVRQLPRLEVAKPATQSKDESVAASDNRPVPAASTNSAASAGSIEFDKDTYVATESDGVVKLTVVRSGSTGKEAKFTWTVLPNSAEAGSDYADFGPTTERIPAGSRKVELNIPLVSDSVKENTELFLVELSTDEGGLTLGERRRAAVILVDDD